MTLAYIWFFLWSLLWAVYFVLDGFDLGIGALLPFAGSERARKVYYNAAGPFWDGNEVWLIAAGGVTFAAFPKTYAVMFSALYTPLLLLLFALILRAVSFEFRNKIDSGAWRGLWDAVHFLTNLVAAILLGVAFANLFSGIPVDANGVLQGNLLSFLTPYGIMGGVFFLSMFALHGALWLCIKTQDKMQERAHAFAKLLWPVTLLLLLAFLVLTGWKTDLFNNYIHYPFLLLIPVGALACLCYERKSIAAGRFLIAWIQNAGFIVFVTFFGVIGMFPRMIISSIDPAAAVTAANGCSSPLTLKIMLGVALVMVPIVLLYQFWTFRLFSSKLTEQSVAEDEHSY